MGKFLFVFGVLLAGSALADVVSTTPPVKAFNDYSSLSCVISSEDGEELATFNERLIVVRMDDHAGLFKQMRLQSGLDQIQLQVLLEDDSAKNSAGAVNFLLNFAVNDKEISSEFSGQNINFVSIKNQVYRARCDVK